VDQVNTYAMFGFVKRLFRLVKDGLLEPDVFDEQIGSHFEMIEDLGLLWIQTR
jgi:hypothetical protein